MSTLAESVARLMRNFSIEIVPREVDGIANLGSALPAATKVYLTRLPKATFGDTLRAAKRIRSLGLEPVPHMTARTTRDPGELREHVAALAGDAGVKEVLLVAGSQRPAGTFERTMQLLETGIFEQAGIERIGVAGHPEGDQRIAAGNLQSALDEKNAYARATGLDLYLVTQFFFDAAPVVAWERRIRERGNRLPVHVGFHGLTGTTGLLKHALACGIGESIKVLAQHTNVLQLAVVRSPDRLLLEIARAADDDPASCFAKAHFFPLGGFTRTAAWANAIAQGRFTIERDGALHTYDYDPAASR